MTKLFSIEFSDGSTLHCDEQNGVAVYGYQPRTASELIKEFMDKIPYSKICAFAYRYAQESEFVVCFTDHVEEASDALQKQLLKAF